MTDFDKLREAAEEIKLDDLQKQRILEACKDKKRRKINFTAIAAVAAVLVITVAVFSPGFLMKAGAPADSAENEAAAENFYAADEDIYYYSDDKSACIQDSAEQKNENSAYSVNENTLSVFNADEFRSIYSTISQQFISLVDYEDFVEWSSSVSEENGMAIVQFVEHFEISKEDFDKANREFAKQIHDFYGMVPLYKTADKSHELCEIYNTDLIYSFNRSAIDEYYKAFADFDYSQEGGAGNHSMPAEIIVPEEYYK